MTMFAILVFAMIVILIAFVLIWLLMPSFRGWIERPKHTMLERERSFESASKDDRDEGVGRNHERG